MLRVIVDVHNAQAAEDAEVVFALLKERFKGRPDFFATLQGSVLDGDEDTGTDVSGVATPIKRGRGRPKASEALPAVVVPPAVEVVVVPAAPAPPVHLANVEVTVEDDAATTADPMNDPDILAMLGETAPAASAPAPAANIYEAMDPAELNAHVRNRIKQNGAIWFREFMESTGVGKLTEASREKLIDALVRDDKAVRPA